MMRRAFSLWALAVAAVLSACGGGGGGSTDSAANTGGVTDNTPVANVLPVSVNSGPTGQFPNLVLTTVTVCMPGTSTCQAIPNVMVDTGSSGLRLLASVLTLALPAVPSPSGTYNECADFADGTVWGGLARADVQMAGETASAQAVQVIHDTGAGAPVPTSCSNQGATEDTLGSLGVNGILGVGLFLQDCGAYCVGTADAVYYDCSAANVCRESTIPLASQVSNPVAFFAQDNNGVILQLTAIPAGGATSGTGNLIFGIGTQSDNTQTGTPIPVAANGAFTATLNGVALPDSFIDSGSTGLFFDDASLAQCSTSGVAAGFYCPGSASALSVTSITVSITGSSGPAMTASVLVANAENLFSSSGLNAFDDLAGPTGSTLPNAFDFGVPFFFGKSVFTAFEQRTTPAGAGPYFAYQAYP